MKDLCCNLKMDWPMVTKTIVTPKKAMVTVPKTIVAL